MAGSPPPANGWWVRSGRWQGIGIVSRMRANEPLVVYDVFDGEVMAVRNDTGTYFSMQEAASLAFQAIAAGHDLAAVAALVAGTYQQPATDVRTDLEAFVAQLREHQLVVDGEPAEPSTPTPPAAVGDYVAPALESYTDMQDLLLFDPIHEVEPEGGWPKVAPPEPA